VFFYIFSTRRQSIISFYFYFKNIFVADAFISPFSTQTMHIKSSYTALLCFQNNLMPWLDSNRGLLVPEADAMSTAPRRLQGMFYFVAITFPNQASHVYLVIRVTRLGEF
jgi:hypothetical protein